MEHFLSKKCKDQKWAEAAVTAIHCCLLGSNWSCGLASAVD